MLALSGKKLENPQYWRIVELYARKGDLKARALMKKQQKGKTKR
jgi:sulfur transfer complex TusBCD TusB component (DsrH family)